MTLAKTRDVREKFKSYCDQAAAGEVYVIPRPQNRNVVIVSEAYFNELSRLAEKQRKAEYMKMLRQSMKEAEDGGFVFTTIDELEKYES